MAHFSPRNHDESDKSKVVTKTKQSTKNSFNDKPDGDKVLGELFITWRTCAIGDSVRGNYCMNDIAVEFLCSLLNANTCLFCCTRNSEPGMFGETQVPYEDKEVN